ncbi:MAG: hypothetical protein WAV07_10390 [Candidatus Contendobacter sp.]
MSELTTLKGRCMYVWQLKPVLVTEGGIDNLVRKAKRAKFSSIWIKVADGGSPYKNITGEMEGPFKEVVAELEREEIDVWGWHVPYAADSENAEKEAQMVARIAHDFGLSGILMDAEAGEHFFKGTATTASEYSKELQSLLAVQSKGLALSSHDIPSNFPSFPFGAFAKHATVNAPQVYYGSSPSVDNRLNKAINATSHVDIPFVPVGAGWIGDGGGCESAAACAERALVFMRLVDAHRFQGYSFWHWLGVPAKLWEVFFTEPVFGSAPILNTAPVLHNRNDADKACIPELIRIGNDVREIAKAQRIAKTAWSRFPHNGCAANLSALLQLAGIDVPMILGAGKLAHTIEARCWERISVGNQQAGDIGVTFDQGTPAGADHIYLVLSVDSNNSDKMLISDNQDNEPHSRYASGHGKTPTEYFLRA